MDLELVHPEVGRKRDLLWEAVMRECGIDAETVTASARGSYNKAVSELRRVRATPGQVAERSDVYRVRWPHVLLTPAALCRHWAELGRVKPASGPACPEHGAGRCVFHMGTGWSHD